MVISETKLRGAFVVDIAPITDDRGFFARVLDAASFEPFGIKTQFPQASVSFNIRRGTLRGMHFQSAPYEEAKLVRCTSGAIYDVIVDLRPNSATFRQWIATELTATNRRTLYIPEGFAHGFQTLDDNTEVYYQMGQVYHRPSARGYRWDDPAFAIEWPETGRRIIAQRDLQFEPFLG